MNRLLVLASAVLACAMPAEDNTRPPPPPPPPPPPSLGGQDTILIAGHALYVPRGFTVNLFVEGLNGVRYLALGPGGAVYASLPGAGRIVRLVDANGDGVRSEEHTSELQSPCNLVCRLLLEKKKKNQNSESLLLLQHLTVTRLKSASHAIVR